MDHFAIKANYSPMMDTMYKGAYYKIDYSEKLTFLSINSLYFDIESTEHDNEEEAKEMYKWLAEVLYDDQNKQRKIVPFYHIWPGLNYVKDKTLHWKMDYIKKYKKLMLDHHTKFPIMIGAHTHYMNFMYGERKPNNYSVRDFFNHDKTTWFDNLYISPSISPIFGNNPGITVFDLDYEMKVKDMKIRYLYLPSTYNKAHEDDFKWRTFDFFEQTGVKHYNSSELYAFEEKLNHDSDELLDFLVAKIGFDPKSKSERKMVLEKYYWKTLGVISKNKNGTYNTNVYQCLLHIFTNAELADCLEEMEKS
jgi:hypothetical protein